MTKLLTVLLLAFETSACAFGNKLPARPDSDACVVNAEEGRQKCFNMKTDFDDNGNLLPTAKPFYKPALTVKDVDKATCFDVEKSLPNLKVYLNELRQAITNRSGD